MDESHDKLTSEQRAHLQPALSKIANGFGELSERLSDLGWDSGDFSCTQCDCPGFVAPTVGPPVRCARPGCNHFFPRHRVF